MSSQPLVSLCMPTNGVVEWVFPVLNSIYAQGIDNSLFEIVITDNGKNKDFKDKMQDYLLNHSNIVYSETEALPFINEIESYKRASGELIKFVNHRTLLVEGALKRLIDFTKDNIEDKPVVYFSNGVLDIAKQQHVYETFDQFVKNLSYWSSWSTGMTIWKSDFNKLPDDVSDFNELFPHTNVLFNERHRGKYIIDNSIIFDELPQGKKPKGNYDLFFAFGVEYPWIICTLLRDGDISKNTYKSVLNKNAGFVADLYYTHVIRKKYCSYNLDGFDNMCGIFYSKHLIIRKAYSVGIQKLFKKSIRG